MLAFILDVILLGIVTSVLSGLTGADLTRRTGLGTLVGLGYCLYFWSSNGGGQTLGMRALSVRVVKTSGAQLTVMDALVRYLGLLLSFIAILLGVIWVAFDAQKQGWHDKIAGTYVVKA